MAKHTGPVCWKQTWCLPLMVSTAVMDSLIIQQQGWWNMTTQN